MNEVALFINKAPLPAVYRDACVALEKCEKLDECKQWSDRALAIASYARQSKDTTLLVVARRIQTRAVERLGELLAEIEPVPGANQNIQEGDHLKVGRMAAAEAAGLSEHQAKQALRVANVPKDERDALIESDTPPTVTELARRGTQKQPRNEPPPYGAEWADWVFAVEHLSGIPDCGLTALALRPSGLTTEQMLAEARFALANLSLWIETLEKHHVAN